MNRIRFERYISSWALLSRELRGVFRSNKSFLVLFLFLVALLFILTQNWIFFARSFEPAGDFYTGTVNRVLVSRGALTLFHALAQGHLLFLIVVIPLLTAPSIAEEREHSTLELLLSSPIPVTRFIMSKLISPLMYIFLLLTAGMPVLSLCFLGGGLDYEQVVVTYVILLATAFSLSCLGIFCSTLRPRIYEVYLIAAFITLLVFFLFPYHGTLWKYVNTLKWEGIKSYNHGFHVLSPFYALYEGLFPSSATKPITLSLPVPQHLFSGNSLISIRIGYPSLLYIFYSLMLGIVSYILAVKQIRRIVLGAGQRWKKQSFPYLYKENELDVKVYERKYEITFDQTSREGNPGLILEQKVQWFARLPVLMRLFYTSLMISVLTLPLASYEGSWLFLILPFLVAVLFTLPLAATSISSDRQRKTLDFLRTSLLSSEQIVYAKFTTNLMYSFFIAFALYLPGMLLQILCAWALDYEVDLITNFGGTFSLLCYPILLLCSLVLYTALGLYFSVYCKTTNRAMLLTGSFILISMLAPAILPTEAFLSKQLGFFYPITYFLLIISPLSGIAALFPSGHIRMFGLTTMMNHHFLFLSGVWFPIVQCGLCVMGTEWLRKKTVHQLDHLD